MDLSVKSYFHKDTSTLTYIVHDKNQAIVIDPVMDFDQAGGFYWTESVEQLISYLKDNSLQLMYILETHVHADHLSGAKFLKDSFPNAKTGINSNIKQVQKLFSEALNIETATDGSQFDLLLEDNQEVECGRLSFKVLHTPGHTPACTCFLMGNMLFTGDTIFMPDFGTGRCDFPAGSAKDLYHSIHEVLYKLPDDTRVFVGHDYQPGGRELAYETTIKDCKENNIQLKDTTSESDFVKFRTDRDSGLSAPKLLYPSLQININAGQIPSTDESGKIFLKVPFKRKEL